MALSTPEALETAPAKSDLSSSHTRRWATWFAAIAIFMPYRFIHAPAASAAAARQPVSISGSTSSTTTSWSHCAAKLRTRSI